MRESTERVGVSQSSAPQAQKIIPETIAAVLAELECFSDEEAARLLPREFDEGLKRPDQTMA